VLKADTRPTGQSTFEGGIMTRNLKVLGPVLFAILVLNAMVASVASGTDLFTSETKTTVVTGSSTTPIEFSIPKTNTKIKCWTTTLSGTLSESAASELTLHPTHSGTEKEPTSKSCELAPGIPIEFKMHGCDYKFPGATLAEEEEKHAAMLHIECPVGEEIEVLLPLGCTLRIPAQTPTAGGMTYKNKTSSEKGVVFVELKATGVTYTSTGTACLGLGMTSEGDSLMISGSWTLSGYKDECSEGECPFVPKGGQEADAYTDSAQVGIEVS
jgi:hypothetical protein